MFENLDDPVPPSPAPIDGVAARGRRLRTQRRMIAGACVAFVLAGSIATAAALQGNGHKKVIVSDESTTTTSNPSASTSTTAPETTTTTSTPTSTVPVVAPLTTTTTTQPPHDPNDLSMISVTWPASSQGDFGNCVGTGFDCHNLLELYDGVPTPISYTVTNNGSWTVNVGECVDYIVELWAHNGGGFGQYDEVWPAPYPARRAGYGPELCADVLDILPPGETRTLTETVVAGYRNAAGAVMPSELGATAFGPSFLPQCSQPCTALQVGSRLGADWPVVDTLAFRVVPPPTASMPYTIHVKTLSPKAPSGQSTQVEMTYTNPLAFTVRTPLFGPCWAVKTGTATVDCSEKLPALIIGPHQTVDLVGTVWARKGFKSTGAPLAPGTYAINLGDQYGATKSTPGFPVPVFTAT
jgi:hypothetical protein